MIVTRDADFGEMASVLGQPPKVIRLRSTNPTRAATLDLLLGQQALIEDALLAQGMAVVELWS